MTAVRRPAGPTRVVTMVDSLLAGGAERVAVEVSCGLDRERFAPHVLVTRGDGPLRALLEQHDVPVTILNRRGAFDLAPWRVARTLVRDGADVLHTHKFGSNIWGAMLARTTGVPLVAHEHNFSQTPSRSRRLLDRWLVARVARRVLCVSDSVADVERSCGVPVDRLVVVPNGVRLDAAVQRDAARAELGIDTSSFVVGIVGRLRPEKAHEVLFEAAAHLTEAGRDVRLCVVGDGPQHGELDALAARMGIDDRVIWAGERRDAARLARAFDASVVCSDWEGLPLAALEAMAAQVPLVATEVGGMPSLLAGGAGRLVPVRDPRALAGALGSLIDDPVAAEATARTGHRRVLETYSFERMVRTIEDIYGEVLAEHRGGRGAAGADHATTQEAA